MIIFQVLNPIKFLNLFLNNIDSKFILPLSPWCGGFYERLARTVKNTLGKILGMSKLNFEELYTILNQVC